MCSVIYRSSPTTAPFLTSHSYDPRLAFDPYRTALRGTLGSGISFVWTQNTTPAVYQTLRFGEPLEHARRSPSGLKTQTLCVLFSTNGPNGHRSATTRPPYELRWRETARKWKSHQYSAICARVSLFSTEWIRIRCRIDKAVEMGATGISSSLVQ